MLVEEVDDVVVHIQFAFGILRVDRFARITTDDQLQRFAGGDVRLHAFLCAHERRCKGQLPVLLELCLP
ncbi:MAG: hypothetical protein HOI65_09425, partial [Opitutae bacterium]|nr:hypothetical protein [Opitutae bacterium]